MSTLDGNTDGRTEDENHTSAQQTSRGEFLKWSGAALGGLYVGPKITSFAVAKGGQTGSPAPTNNNTQSYSSSSGYSSSPASVLPATGGGAGAHPVDAKPAQHADRQDWVPAAGAGAAALGWYIRKQAKGHETVEVRADEIDQTE